MFGEYDMVEYSFNTFDGEEVNIISNKEMGYVDIEDISNPNDPTRFFRLTCVEAEHMAVMLAMAAEDLVIEDD